MLLPCILSICFKYICRKEVREGGKRTAAGYSDAIVRTTVQGEPKATTLGGTDLVTTLLAPMIEVSPIVTPGRIITPAAMKQFFPTVTLLLS